MALDNSTLAAMQFFAGTPAVQYRPEYAEAVIKEAREFEEGPHGDPHLGPILADSLNPRAFIQNASEAYFEKIEAMTYGDFRQVATAIGYAPADTDLLTDATNIGDMFKMERAVGRRTEEAMDERNEVYQLTDEEKANRRAHRAFALISSATTEYKAIGLQTSRASMVADTVRSKLEELANGV